MIAWSTYVAASFKILHTDDYKDNLQTCLPSFLVEAL